MGPFTVSSLGDIFFDAEILGVHGQQDGDVGLSLDVGIAGRAEAFVNGFDALPEAVWVPE